MPEPKPGILRNLRVKRLALVDVGANLDDKTGDGAHIMLFKGKDGLKKGPDVAAVHADSLIGDDERDEYEKATIDAATRNKLPDSDFAAVWTDAQGKKQRKLPIHDAGHLAAARGRIADADIPASVKAEAQRKIDAATKTKEKSVKKNLLQKMLGLFNETDPAKRTAAAEEIVKAFPDDPDDCDSEEMKKKAEEGKKKAEADEMAKSGNAALIAKLAASDARAAAAETRANEAITLAKALRDESTNREMVDILKGFKATSFDLTDMTKDVAVFRKMKEADPSMFERTIALMKAQDAQLAQSNLYKDLGTGRTGEGSAWGQIEAKADAMVEKSTSGLTHAQAVEKVLMAHPKLARQYRAEQQ